MESVRSEPTVQTRNVKSSGTSLPISVVQFQFLSIASFILRTEDTGVFDIKDPQIL